MLARRLTRFLPAMSLAQALDTTRILKQPSPPILPLLADAHAVMMKAGIAEQVNRKDPKFLVGTGRFKYKAHTLGVDSRTKRNPNYWKPGVPHIDGYQAYHRGDSGSDQNFCAVSGAATDHDEDQPPSRKA
jgi:peptide/nickel transport system substrate-binding protein